jgi:hypothetical protein
MLTVLAYGCASYPPFEPLAPLSRRFLYFFDDAGSLHRVAAMFASLCLARFASLIARCALLFLFGFL